MKIGEVIRLLQEKGMPFDINLRLNQILNQIPANLTIEEAKSEYDKDLASRDAWKFM